MKKFCILFLLFLLSDTSLCTKEGFDFEALSDLARTFSEVVGNTEDCVFKCPNSAKPRAKPGHRPTSNGCGSYGIKIDSDTVPGMSECCDSHDICYDTCGMNKKECDKDFRSCLDNICTKLRGTSKQHTISSCRTTSNIMFTGAVTLGCDAYLTAQGKACFCVARPPNPEL